MNTAFVSSLAAAGCAAALVFGAAAPASAAVPAVAASSVQTAADGSQSLATLQQKGAAAIDNRLASLLTAQDRVTAAHDLTDADRAAILGTMQSDASALTSLKAKLAADTDAKTAAADVQSIYTDYRAYAVVIPQSLIATGADRLTTSAVPHLQQAHDELAAHGADAAQLAAMQTAIDTASKDLDGLAASALAVTPAAYNANHAVIPPLRARLDDASAQLRQAGAIGRSLAGTAVPAPSATATP